MYSHDGGELYAFRENKFTAGNEYISNNDGPAP